MTQILKHKYIILLLLLWPTIYLFPIFSTSVFLLICRPFPIFLLQIFFSISFLFAKYFPPLPSPFFFSSTIQICIIIFQIFSLSIRILLHWPNIFHLFLPRSSFALLTKYYPSPNIFLFFLHQVYLSFPFHVRELFQKNWSFLMTFAITRCPSWSQ